MDEWKLSVLITSFGLEKVLDSIPMPMVELGMSFPRFDTLPKDLLILFLSYTALRDTLAVMCVCKAWYEASKMPAFWARRILDRKKAIGVTNGYKAKQLAALMQFNTFRTCDEAKESLRNKVGWLFYNGHLRVEERTFALQSPLDPIERYYLIVRICDNKSVTIQMYNQDLTSKMQIWNVSIKFSSLHSIINSLDNTDAIIVWDNRADGCQKAVYSVKKACPTITYKSVYGTFVGDSIDISGTGEKVYAPHGYGEWNLKCGLVIRGDGAAWKGEPRLSLPSLSAASNETIYLLKSMSGETGLSTTNSGPTAEECGSK